MNQVYRKQTVIGMEIPGIIHNQNYYFSLLPVYEDGVVSCWHKSDLEQFRHDLQEGWVVPSVPLGSSLNVHQLGNFSVVDAQWDYDVEGFFHHVEDCVREMNPEMENLWRATPRIIEKWEKLRIEWLAGGTPCKQVSEFGYELASGSSVHIFYRQNEVLYLTVLTVYKDKTLSIGQEDGHFYTLEEIDALFAEGTLCTQPKEAEWVTVNGLGRLLFGVPDEDEDNIVAPAEKQKEVAELLKELVGEKTAHALCISAYHEYLVETCDWTREKLRKAYEAVPEHERMYLGNMDIKDRDFRRILYHPTCKREV